MSKNFFVDNVGDVGIIDGVVRCDLVTMRSSGKENQLNQETVATMTTSIQGLIRINDQLTKVIKKMEADGLVTKKAASPAVKKPPMKKAPAFNRKI